MVEWVSIFAESFALLFFLIDAMEKLARACCTNPLRFGLAFYDFQFLTPCEKEFLTQGQFKISS